MITLAWYVLCTGRMQAFILLSDGKNKAAARSEPDQAPISGCSVPVCPWRMPVSCCCVHECNGNKNLNNSGVCSRFPLLPSQSKMDRLLYGNVHNVCREQMVSGMYYLKDNGSYWSCVFPPYVRNSLFGLLWAWWLLCCIVTSLCSNGYVWVIEKLTLFW